MLSYLRYYGVNMMLESSEQTVSIEHIIYSPFSFRTRANYNNNIAV